MNLPARADPIGSLLRPRKLRDAFRRLSGGELRAVQDEAIRDAVRMQQDCGLQVITDGEFRRVSYWEKFVRLTAGLEVKNAVFTFHDAEGHESSFTAPHASGKLARREPITLDEFAFPNQKITMPAPSTMHFYRFTDWGSAYREPEAFFADLGKVYQAEIKGVMLGLVSSKTPLLEKIDQLKKRADEAARFVDPARLAISPQCGFASTMGGNPLSEADQRAKLELCVDAARSIWG